MWSAKITTIILANTVMMRMASPFIVISRNMPKIKSGNSGTTATAMVLVITSFSSMKAFFRVGVLL